MRRIGIDCRMFGPQFGGIGRYTQELVEHLTQIDKDNYYVLFFNSGQEIDSTRFNAEIIKVNAPHYSFAEQWNFLKVLKKTKLDLMHFTHFNAPILYRGKTVVTIHDLTLHHFSGRKLRSWFRRCIYKFVIRMVARHASRVIAVSKYTKGDIVKYLGVKPSKISVTYEAVDAKFHPLKYGHTLEHIRKKYGISKPFFLYTGNFTPHKNLLALVEAFLLCKQHGEFPYQLMIAGKPVGNYANQVVETIRNSKQHDILLPGFIDEHDFVPLLNAAHAYVFPSLSEGFGLPPLEAFACATPVAASNVTSIPEVCGPGNALYFDPRNNESIAKALYQIATDEMMRRTLIERGLKRVQEFSWEKMAKETLAIYLLL